MAYRREKINELLKQIIGQIFLEEESFGPGVLATILEVQATEDGRQATVFFSVWPDEKTAAVELYLEGRRGAIQHELKERVKLYPVPQIKFKLSQEEAEGQRVTQLLKKISREENL